MVCRSCNYVTDGVLIYRMQNLIEIDWYFADPQTGEVFVEDGDVIRPAQLSDFLVDYQND